MGKLNDIRQKAIEILAGSQEGMQQNEIVQKLKMTFPDYVDNDFRNAIWNIHKHFPEKVKRIGKGRYKLKKFLSPIDKEKLSIEKSEPEKAILEIIEIKWDGPHTITEIKEKMRHGTDYGIYQIYGTHDVFGPNALLYVGKAEEQPFSARIKQHDDTWLNMISSEVEIYVGRLGGLTQVSDEEWSKKISQAEKLLIYFSSPPYNSQNLSEYGDISKTIVLNFGKRNRLPVEVSTLWKESDVFYDKWKPFFDQNT